MEIKKYPLMIIFLLVLSLSFVLALHVLTPKPYDIGLGYSFDETLEINVINITVNNTYTGGDANITQVNITLPSTFTFIFGTEGVGENETVANFQNSSTSTNSTLSWENNSAASFLINGTEAGVLGNWTYFWFNISATTPGTYNITITTVNDSGTVTYDQNISVQINDTTEPFSVSFDTGSPAANVNLSQSHITVNITANDTDGAYAGDLNEISIAISNSSGVWNTTITSTNSDTINFTGLIDGIYYINATANDTLGNTNSTGTETRTITLDTLAPAIAYLGGLYVDTSNISATTIFVNISITELYNDTIVFNLYNGSGLVNSTQYTDGSKNVTWTGLTVNGDYTFNVTANDTAGNSNSTASRTFTLDTTDPTATASCTPASLVQNAVETCSCSGTDTGGSGINPTLTSATTTPITDATGTYDYTCEVTDYAGNSASSTTSYQVTGTSNGPGGSTTTTSFWTKGTQTVTDEQFTESYTKTLSVRQRIKVKVETLNHYIGVVGLTTTTATINVSSEPQQATLIIGDERRFEVSGDEYYDILVKLNSIENNKANITVQSIHELVTEDTTEGEEELEGAGETAKEEEEAKEEGLNIWWIIGIVALILIIVGIIYAKKR